MIVAKNMLGDISLKCIENGITLILSNEEKVKLPEEADEFRSSGFFCHETKQLVVGTKKPFEDWFITLLHEYNHMVQWKEGPYFSKKFTDAYDLFWEWLDHNEEIGPATLEHIVGLVRDVEMDCEFKTYKMIRDNPYLNIDCDEYMKKANVYLYSYAVVKDLRKWYKNPPYFVKAAVDMMPNIIVEDYNILPAGFKELMTEQCF